MTLGSHGVASMSGEAEWWVVVGDQQGGVGLDAQRPPADTDDVVEQAAAGTGR